jgi:transposase-like protein
MSKKPVIVKREIRLAYVEQILLKKLTVGQTAQELNVKSSAVYDWLKKYREDPKDFMPGSGKQKPADAEVTKIYKIVQSFARYQIFLNKNFI